MDELKVGDKVDFLGELSRAYHIGTMDDSIPHIVIIWLNANKNLQSHCLEGEAQINILKP
jgi:hypothetical protein